MSNEDKATDIARHIIETYADINKDNLPNALWFAAINMAEWKDKNPSIETIKAIVCYALKHTNIMLAEDLENDVDWETLIKAALAKKKIVMTQEEKNILVKELCMRMPYGVKCNINGEMCEIEWIDVIYQRLYLKKDNGHSGTYSIARGDVIKPYLRPLLSMTEKEKEYIRNRWCYEEWYDISDLFNNYQLDFDEAYYFIDWLNSHHFDHRGLIEKGLALVAPEDMYQDIVL